MTKFHHVRLWKSVYNYWTELGDGYRFCLAKYEVGAVGSAALPQLTSAMRTFTSAYQLLPRYECYDRGDGKLVRVGESTGIPNVDSVKAAAAIAFPLRPLNDSCHDTPPPVSDLVTVAENVPRPFATSPVGDGNYHATLAAGSVSDTAGVALTQQGPQR